MLPIADVLQYFKATNTFTGSSYCEVDVTIMWRVIMVNINAVVGIDGLTKADCSHADDSISEVIQIKMLGSYICR